MPPKKEKSKRLPSPRGPIEYRYTPKLYFPLPTGRSPVSGNVGGKPAGAGVAVSPAQQQKEQVGRRKTVQFLQDMFRGRVDPDLVETILSDSGWQEEVATETLIKLSEGSDHHRPSPTIGLAAHFPSDEVPSFRHEILELSSQYECTFDDGCGGFDALAWAAVQPTAPQLSHSASPSLRSLMLQEEEAAAAGCGTASDPAFVERTLAQAASRLLEQRAPGDPGCASAVGSCRLSPPGRQRQTQLPLAPPKQRWQQQQHAASAEIGDELCNDLGRRRSIWSAGTTPRGSVGAGASSFKNIASAESSESLEQNALSWQSGSAVSGLHGTGFGITDVIASLQLSPQRGPGDRTIALEQRSQQEQQQKSLDVHYIQLDGDRDIVLEKGTFMLQRDGDVGCTEPGGCASAGAPTEAAAGRAGISQNFDGGGRAAESCSGESGSDCVLSSSVASDSSSSASASGSSTVPAATSNSGTSSSRSAVSASSAEAVNLCADVSMASANDSSSVDMERPSSGDSSASLYSHEGAEKASSGSNCSDDGSSARGLWTSRSPEERLAAADALTSAGVAADALTPAGVAADALISIPPTPVPPAVPRLLLLQGSSGSSPSAFSLGASAAYMTDREGPPAVRSWSSLAGACAQSPAGLGAPDRRRIEPSRTPYYHRHHGSGGRGASVAASAAAQSRQKEFITTVRQSASEGVKILVLMRGCPGSGKSTVARQLKGEKGVVLTTDDFFMVDGRYDYDYSRIGEAHTWNRRRAEQALKDGVTPVVIDNTNTMVWEMGPYVSLAIDRGYRVELCEPATEWRFDAAELHRRNSHGVPFENIVAMIERYEHNVKPQDVISFALRNRNTGPDPGKTANVNNSSFSPPQPLAAKGGPTPPPPTTTTITAVAQEAALAGRLPAVDDSRTRSHSIGRHKMKSQTIRRNCLTPEVEKLRDKVVGPVLATPQDADGSVASPSPTDAASPRLLHGFPVAATSVAAAASIGSPDAVSEADHAHPLPSAPASAEAADRARPPASFDVNGGQQRAMHTAVDRHQQPLQSALPALPSPSVGADCTTPSQLWPASEAVAAAPPPPPPSRLLPARADAERHRNVPQPPAAASPAHAGTEAGTEVEAVRQLDDRSPGADILPALARAVGDGFCAVGGQQAESAAAKEGLSPLGADASASRDPFEAEPLLFLAAAAAPELCHGGNLTRPTTAGAEAGGTEAAPQLHRRMAASLGSSPTRRPATEPAGAGSELWSAFRGSTTDRAAAAAVVIGSVIGTATAAPQPSHHTSGARVSAGTMAAPGDFALVDRVVHGRAGAGAGWRVVAARGACDRLSCRGPSGPRDAAAAALPRRSMAAAVCFDKSTMTDDEPESSAGSGEQLLASLFPLVPAEYLREVLSVCRDDVSWATNTLLDSGCDKADFSWQHPQSSAAEASLTPTEAPPSAAAGVGRGPHAQPLPRLSAASAARGPRSHSLRRQKKKKMYRPLEPKSWASFYLSPRPSAPGTGKHQCREGSCGHLEHRADFVSKSGTVEAGDLVALSLTSDSIVRLVELFGDLGDTCSSGIDALDLLFGAGALDVQLPVELARQLHAAIKMTMSAVRATTDAPAIGPPPVRTPTWTRPFNLAAPPSSYEPATAAVSAARAAVACDRALTMETSDADLARLLLECEEEDGGGYSGGSPAKWQPPLYEIMDAQLAEQLEREEWQTAFGGRSKELTMAERLRRQQLYGAYPNEKAEVLNATFDDCGRDLQRAMDALGRKAAFPMDDRGTVASAASAFTEDVDDEWEDVLDEPCRGPGDSSALMAEDRLYKESREQANLHMSLKKECTRKAMLARSGRGPSAAATVAWYTQQARSHAAEARRCHRLAAQRIFHVRNSSQLHGVSGWQELDAAAAQPLSATGGRQLPLTVDLHGLHAGEAVAHLRSVIDSAHADFARHPGRRKRQLAVITGKGTNSRGGIPRVKQAVVAYLQQKDVSFSEVNEGFLQVNLFRTAPRK